MGYPKWTGSYDLKQIGTILRRAIFFMESVPVYRFANDPTDPLTLWVSEKEWYQPFRTFDGFDFGSVPLALQSLVSPLSAPKSFALHDSNYEFHAVWAKDGMVRISRKKADDLLAIGMRAEGCNWWLRNKAWLGVRVGGGGVWEKDYDTTENAIRNAIAEDNPQGTEDDRI